MASRFASVTSEEMIQINFFVIYYLTVLVYTKTTVRLSVCVIQINFFGVYYLTVLVHTKTTIHLSIDGQRCLFNKHKSLHLGRKYARIFVLGHYLFLVALGRLFATRNR